MERNKLIDLVTGAQKGDGKAMEALFEAFYNDVYYFALKTVKDEDTACDITQDTFLEVIRTIGNLKEPAAFVTWLKQVSYHQCTKYFAAKKEVLVEEDEEGNTVFDNLVDESEGSIPAEVYEKEEFRSTVLGIIDELTEQQRSAVLLYYFDELSVGQIAEIQGVSEGTVKSRLNYARKALKKSVEAYEKKHDVKLHSVALLPLLLLFFRRERMPEAKAAEVRAVVTKAASGTAVKAAGLSLGVKIAVGALVAAVAIGGAVALMGFAEKETGDGSAAPTSDIGSKPESAVPTEKSDYTNHLWELGFDLEGVVQITFTNMPVPEGIQPEDISHMGDGSVLMWKEAAQDQSGLNQMYVTAADGGMIYAPQNCATLFANAQKLEVIRLDNFDTSHVTNMNFMFGNCKGLKVLDVSGLDTASVTDMGGMFFGCEQLESLHLANFDTAKVTDMSAMFGHCFALRELDVSTFQTANVQTFGGMFTRCEALEALDVSGFDVSNAKDLSEMFSLCKALKQLDVSGFNTASATAMDGMFSHCYGLTALDVSGFDTAKVKNMFGMFAYSRNLSYLDVSRWNTGKVEDMDSIFSGCVCLQEPDISGWKIPNGADLGLDN